jgi:hypothetical protein
MSLGNYKIKQKIDAIASLLAIKKFKTLINKILMGFRNKKTFVYCWLEIQNGILWKRAWQLFIVMLLHFP